MKTKFSKLRILLSLALALPVFLFLLYFTRGFWLTQMGRWLLVDEAVSSPHDIVLILGGDLLDRPRKAADLVNRGLAKKVVWMNPETGKEVELNICPQYSRSISSLMTKFGVPSQKFQFYNNLVEVSSTKEEAETFAKFLSTEGKDVRSVIIVTSWFHTRRAKKTFLKFLNRPDLKYTIVATYGDSSPQNWWQSEGGFLEVYTEYLKWVYHGGRQLLGRN